MAQLDLVENARVKIVDRLLQTTIIGTDVAQPRHTPGGEAACPCHSPRPCPGPGPGPLNPQSLTVTLNP
jgi:hypothetical protein